MSRIHEIILIPGAGHAGRGIYERGHEVDAYAEVDLVDLYARTIREELDNSLIRYRIVNTRKAPGTPHTHRFDDAFPNCLPVQLTVGWNTARKATPIHNLSVISANKDCPQRLVAQLADCLRLWGGLYVHGHRCAEPAQQAELGITIAPFQINGRHAGEYAKHLDKLGRDIGRVFVDFCRSRQDDAAIKFVSGGMQKGAPRG